MESYYEINVSLNGLHLFATAPRSAVTLYDAKHITEELRKRFPEAEGYSVTCTYWKTEGHTFFD